MNQKRFLTADEVFQLFGVDADSLKELVESGKVKALADLGTHKFRAEDFAVLVREGKLTPRTSAEMWQSDSHGDIPFLKIDNRDAGLKFDDDVSFLELDEDALNEQAAVGAARSKTPDITDNWLDDLGLDDQASRAPDTASELKIGEVEPTQQGSAEATDFELNISAESDSDVQVLGDDERIDLDAPEVEPTASDSDVRLEGPVSSFGSSHLTGKKKSDSDSDVRLFKNAKRKPESDSDVTLHTSLGGKLVPSSFESASDSDVQLVFPSDGEAASAVAGKVDSDSDVVLVSSAAANTDGSTSAKSPDNKVDLSKTSAQMSTLNPEIQSAATVRSDSGIRLQSSDQPVLHETPNTTDTDSDIRLEPAGGYAPGRTPAPVSIARAEVSSDDDSGIRFDDTDRGFTLESAPVASTSNRSEEDSGITLESSDADSGITFDSGNTDSGIALDLENMDSGITLQSASGSSGLSLDTREPDSGIMLDDNDSGIRYESTSDSGLSLEADSGISLHSAGKQAKNPTSHDFKTDAEANAINDQTQTFDLSDELAKDSGFDVNLAESDQTIEMNFSDDDSDSTETVVKTGRTKGAATNPLSLSEAFNLDEPLEVEDLDISEDLDPTGGSDYSGEFVATDLEEESEGEVLDASDEDFSAAEIDVAEQSEDDLVAPVAKVRLAPREPAWGMAAVAPIIGSSLVMAATVIILWGGIATMWTGAEAPTPANTLISVLAGLIPG